MSGIREKRPSRAPCKQCREWLPGELLPVGNELCLSYELNREAMRRDHACPWPLPTRHSLLDLLPVIV